MRGKKRGLVSGIFLLGFGIFLWLGLLTPAGGYDAASDLLRLNFPVPTHLNQVKVQLSEECADFQKHYLRLQDFASGLNHVLTWSGLNRQESLSSLPFRDTGANEQSLIEVVPGGQSIGVLLRAQGVIVVGHAAIQDPSGNKCNPAVEAGVRVGDIILKINNEDVNSEGQVRDMVNRAGDSGQCLQLEIKRGYEIFNTAINPVYCTETSRYRIGLLVKDSAAGLGTLTFYEPESTTFGALGHIITDMETAQPFNLSGGKIVGASVQAINKGKRGQPGEKIGTFQGDRQINGTISKNTNLGIFGRLQKPPANTGSVAVAPADQIHPGAAEILTVLKGEQVEKFSVEILKLNLKAVQDGKGMIIKITDPRLLEQTGGIIQGMSGSPIIQEGKLVGAVTHVFVNDPTRGYAVPVEWMLWEAEILPINKRMAS